MDVENDNEQPQSSASTSTTTTNSSGGGGSDTSANSSNNSSSSNLLVNLSPMLQQQQQQTSSSGEEQQLELPPPSSATLMSSMLINNNNNAITTTSLSTPSSSSSTSSSSSSQSSATSHNLQFIHENYTQQTTNPNTTITTTTTSTTHLHTSPSTEHHSHQQEHSPPPSSQLDVLLPSENTTTTTTTTSSSSTTANTNVAGAALDIVTSYNSEGLNEVPAAGSISLTSGLLLPINSSSNNNLNLNLNLNSGGGTSSSSNSSSSSSTSNRLASARTTLPHLNVLAETRTQLLTSLPSSLNSNIYAQSFTHPQEHQNQHQQQHFQYHQHSHHYHSPAGCSNILAVNKMYTNSDYEHNINNAENGLTVDASGSQTIDRIKLLYPNVDESVTPLPRCWSAQDKCLAIGLSQNNLRVHYKGKLSNDAASVRTAHPIPAACGLYYFEVKIVSKGKNGYMGIGLTAQQFRMNRLPGWDKQSYGYHGDDGNSFSSSGNGQAYGPTFTTGDIIGCCVNFVDNTCFYTKNGIDLGVAFKDLPAKLYPTVGLQTPGEEVDANFGQEPFKFDQIEDMMKQMRAELKADISYLPLPVELGAETALVHKLVTSYLVHNGYTQTIEAFAGTTGQTFREDLPSIRTRQKILKLVMAGQMGQAIEQTMRCYPGLLENNKKLWFTLKCRQFVEMINGSDEYCPNKLITQTNTPPNQTSVIQSTKSYQNGKDSVIKSDNKHNHTISISDGATSNGINKDSATDYMNDVEMENNGHAANGDACKTDNNYHNCENMDEDMDIEMATHRHTQGIERILEFGKELFQMSQLLDKENRLSEEDRQMLENAFSLIAYSNPWSSPMGWQLCPSKRESVCTALNSAILESLNYAPKPPLNIAVAHAGELLKLMAHKSIGACAFVNIEDIFPKN